MTTRKILVEDMQGMETIILDLEGVTPRPELSDKKVVLMICRCLWHILEWLIRRAAKDDNQILVNIDAAPAWDSTTKYQPGTKVMYHGEEHIIGKTEEIEM